MRPRLDRGRSNGRSTITILNTEPRLTWTDDFARVVRAHVDGYASDEDVGAPAGRHRRTGSRSSSTCGTGPGPRSTTCTRRSTAPSASSCWRTSSPTTTASTPSSRELVHVEEPEPAAEPAPNRGRDPRSAAPEPPAPWAPALQLSWLPGRVVAWVGGPGVRPQDPPAGPTSDHDDGADDAGSDDGDPGEAAGQDDLARRLAAAGADTVAWERHPPITLPDGTQADAVSVPLDAVLGWLVARGSVRPAPAGVPAPPPDDEARRRARRPGRGRRRDPPRRGSRRPSRAVGSRARPRRHRAERDLARPRHRGGGRAGGAGSHGPAAAPPPRP